MGPKQILYLVLFLILVSILLILIAKYLKTISQRRVIATYMNNIFAGLMLEEQYVEYIFNIENGRRNKSEIKAEFREQVITNNNSLRTVEFPDEKTYSEMRKQLNQI